MKKIFTIVFIGLLFFSQAQDSAQVKVYRNEFGLDATGFLKQVLNFSQQQQFSTYYFPTYYLTYRRYFKCGNLRAAVGYDLLDAETPTGNPQDANKYRHVSHSVDSRIGWEFASELSKRWQVFYGLDLRPAYTYDKNDCRYSNGGYANGIETRTQIYSIAPLLGFRFRLGSRLSILTEASFSVNVQKNQERIYYTPTSSSSYPSKPDEPKTTTQKMFTSFGQPLSVFIVFAI